MLHNLFPEKLGTTTSTNSNPQQPTLRSNVLNPEQTTIKFSSPPIRYRTLSISFDLHTKFEPRPTMQTPIPNLHHPSVVDFSSSRILQHFPRIGASNGSVCQSSNPHLRSPQTKHYQPQRLRSHNPYHSIQPILNALLTRRA